MPPMNRKVIAVQMVTDLDQEIGALRLKIEGLNHELTALESQRDAAKILAGMKPVRPRDMPTVQVLRAKNLSEVVFQFLRDRCPNGATALELQLKLAGSGLPPGSRTYIYKILNDLESDGRVQKGEDRKWRVVPESDRPKETEVG
jgi:hypothetical protein